MQFNAFKSGVGLKAGQNVQSAHYAHLQTLTPPDWCCTLNRKFEGFECLGDDFFIPSVVTDWLAARLKGVGPRIAMCVLKSWANAWTTSLRMQEARELPCIFGCPDCVDDLEHYINCDPLWTVVISCSSGLSELLHAGPHTKFGLCLDDSTIAWWRMLSIAFSCYHAIKIGHYSDIINSLESGNSCQVHSRLLEYARAYANDLWTVI